MLFPGSWDTSELTCTYYKESTVNVESLRSSQTRSGMVSLFVFGSLGACERLARRAESQVEGSNGCMREDYLEGHCECEGGRVEGH